MKSCIALIAIVVIIALSESVAADEKKKLQIGIKKKVENCEMRSKKGDSLHM